MKCKNVSPLFYFIFLPVVKSNRHLVEFKELFITCVSDIISKCLLMDELRKKKRTLLFWIEINILILLKLYHNPPVRFLPMNQTSTHKIEEAAVNVDYSPPPFPSHRNTFRFINSALKSVSFIILC